MAFQVAPTANWTLRPENLGSNPWSLDCATRPDSPVVELPPRHVIEQTPAGDVRREIEDGERKGWVFVPRRSAYPPAGSGAGVRLHETLPDYLWRPVYLCRRAGGQYDAQAGYDFDRQRLGSAKGGVRFLMCLINFTIFAPGQDGEILPPPPPAAYARIERRLRIGIHPM
jgi:hypothetical protein